MSLPRIGKRELAPGEKPRRKMVALGWIRVLPAEAEEGDAASGQGEIRVLGVLSVEDQAPRQVSADQPAGASL